MKILMLILLVSLSLNGWAQQQKEMDIYDGLMYASTDIQEMKKTTDSLNLRYLECVANPVYYSWPQTQAMLIKLKVLQKHAEKVVSRLKQNIPLEQIYREIPEVVAEDSTHVVLARRPRDTKYDKEDETVLYSGNGNGFNNFRFSGQLIWGSYIFDSDNMGKYTFISVWRLDKPFSTVQLPQEYAKMIQYVDCMIDTNMVLMLDKGRSYEEDNLPLDSLKMLVFLKRHKLPTGDRKVKYIDLEEADEQYVREEFNNNPRIRQLFSNAVKEALEKGNGSTELESLAEGLCSKDTILLMKRSRIVVGSCSMDDAPRRHARDIATLAAQTHQWPVFIRAHLDIMNDHFQRMSDGSYAQPMRKTYLRELELLDIPAQKLLLGSVLQLSNVPESHYYGNIRRIGRAFTESEHAADFEKTVKAYMKDEQLDPFNKCLFFLLYASYCYQQPEVAGEKSKISELKMELDAYPEYVREGIRGLER
jgi:hypothetical protein